MQLYGDFNLPKVDCLLGTTDDCDRVTDRKASWFFTFINFSGLIQYNHIKNVDVNTLDIMLQILVSAVWKLLRNLVNIDSFHPPFVVTFNATFYQCVLTSKLVYCYTKGNYFNLYKQLSRTLGLKFMLQAMQTKQRLNSPRLLRRQLISTSQKGNLFPAIFPHGSLKN